MKKVFGFSLSVVALAAVTGCASWLQPASVAAPEAFVAPPASAAMLAYRLARQTHANGQLSLARTHYEAVLKLEPRHVEALNGLAVVHAHEQRFDESLAIFAWALVLSPDSAHIRNNAGYTYLRAGKLAQARAELERAIRLDPSDTKVAANIKRLQAAEVADSAVQGTTVQAIAAPTPAPPPMALALANERAGLVQISPQVFELRAAKPVAVLAAEPLQSVPLAQLGAVLAVGPSATGATDATPPIWAVASSLAASGPVVALPLAREAGPADATHSARPLGSLHGLRLEVANGSGVRHLARRTALGLASSGIANARLTNAASFANKLTRIEYGPGQEKAALALLAKLPLSAVLLDSRQLARGVQVRLVLGRDATGTALTNWLSGQPAQELAAATGSGATSF